MKKLLCIIACMLLPMSILHAATWYDTGDPATADSSQAQGDSGFTYVDNSGLLILPAGTVSKIRVRIANSDFGQGVKYGLYDNSGNLVAGGSVTEPVSTNFWQELSVTPTIILAGTYRVAMTANDNSTGLSWAVKSAQPSGTGYVSFSTTYAAFPTATLPSNGGNLTELFFVGAFVEPSGGATTVTASRSFWSPISFWAGVSFW